MKANKQSKILNYHIYWSSTSLYRIYATDSKSSLESYISTETKEYFKASASSGWYDFNLQEIESSLGLKYSMRVPLYKELIINAVSDICPDEHNKMTRRFIIKRNINLKHELR